MSDLVTADRKHADETAAQNGWTIEQHGGGTTYRRRRLVVEVDWTHEDRLRWAGARTGPGFNRQTDRQWELLAWLESQDI
jgi:hypothetical protein